MGIIRDALIGIALYEAVNYLLEKQSEKSSSRERSVNVRNTEALPTEQYAEPAFAAATDPEVPLTGDGSVTNRKDAWTNSLANDELRAPDS
jgi:hypothetical protein